MPKTSSQLLNKTILILFPLFIVVTFLVSIWRYYNVRDELITASKEQLIAMAATGATSIDGDIFQNITEPSDFNGENYLLIAQRLKSIKDANNLASDAVKTLRRKGNFTSFVVTSTDDNLIDRDFNLWLEMNPTLNSGTVEVKMPYQKNDKIYMSVFAPIKSNLSQVVGMLQIDKEVGDQWPAISEYLLLSLYASILIVVLGFIILKILLKPLQNKVNTISQYLNTLASGQLDSQYTDLDSSYLLEITTVLEKLQSGLQKHSESEEDKEKLQKQIKELLRIVSAAADGDFTQNAQVTADTLGALADSFNLMVSDLSSLIKDVKKSAEQVSQFTKGSLETTTTMANGAEKQAREIEHISQLAKDMVGSASNTNNSAIRAVESAKLAKEVAERGGTIVKQSIEGMHRIKETVLDTSKRVKSLGESSTRIGEISEFISDIASRTNLLALNATIEAARAGEAGRGFTVVADEVRNLAERSSHAASEITQLIEDIQNGTSETVMAMELGNNEVAEGTKMVDAAGAALREILGAVNISTTSVEEITNATTNQLKSSEDIMGIMERIAKIAQQTAEGAKNSEGEISRLESLSKSLIQAVEKFKLSQ